jgi:hypothetical protein
MYAAMKDELVRWHSPHAAEQIAEKMLIVLRASDNWNWENPENQNPSQTDSSVREENPQTAVA